MTHMDVVIMAGIVTWGVILGPIIAQGMSEFREFLVSTLRLILSSVIVSKDLSPDLRTAIVGHLMEKESKEVKGRKFAGAKRFIMKQFYVRPLKTYRDCVVYRPVESWVFLKFRKAWILYTYVEGEADKIHYLRGTVDLGALWQEVEAYHNQTLQEINSQQKKFRVIKHFGTVRDKKRQFEKGAGTDDAPPATNQVEKVSAFEGNHLVCWDGDDVGPNVDGAGIDDLSLCFEQKDVVRRMRFWHDHEGWYQERGIAWRIGCLFHGQPGTGKTSLTRAVAEDLDLPVHVLDLSSMDNEDFMEAWGRTRGQGPRMVLFEDFDAVFCGRENVAHPDGDGMTFDALLNVLDGVEREHGLLLVVTTNHPEHLDPALGVPEGPGGVRSTRPGRINLVLEFGPLDKLGREKLALRIVRDPDVVPGLVHAGAGDSADQFTERCTREALRLLWEEQDAARAGVREAL